MGKPTAKPPFPWRAALAYGAALAAGALALQWLDYREAVRAHPQQLTIALVAAAFLALGAYVGAKALRPRAPAPFNGNPQAVASLGLTAREVEVLALLAEGGSNAGIARALGVSPHTVKTHLAHLYDKLGAARRTEAVAEARRLGILP